MWVFIAALTLIVIYKISIWEYILYIRVHSQISGIFLLFMPSTKYISCILTFFPCPQPTLGVTLTLVNCLLPSWLNPIALLLLVSVFFLLLLWFFFVLEVGFLYIFYTEFLPFHWLLRHSLLLVLRFFFALLAWRMLKGGVWEMSWIDDTVLCERTVWLDFITLAHYWVFTVLYVYTVGQKKNHCSFHYQKYFRKVLCRDRW